MILVAMSTKARRFAVADDQMPMTSVFLPHSEFDPAPQFPEARAVITAVTAALQSARPSAVVLVSTIGAQAAQTNLLPKER
jgi:hypothetical protein